jgi:hypothetical protein
MIILTGASNAQDDRPFGWMIFVVELALFFVSILIPSRKFTHRNLAAWMLPS